METFLLCLCSHLYLAERLRGQGGSVFVEGVSGRPTEDPVKNGACLTNVSAPNGAE